MVPFLGDMNFAGVNKLYSCGRLNLYHITGISLKFLEIADGILNHMHSVGKGNPPGIHTLRD